MADKLTPGRKLKKLIETGETILVPGAHDPLMAVCSNALASSAANAPVG